MNSEARARHFGLLADKFQRRRVTEEIEARKRRTVWDSSDRKRNLTQAGHEAAALLESAEAAHARLAHTHPSVRQAALYFICHYWKIAEECREDLARLATVDPDSDVRASAIGTLGIVYRETANPRIGQLLAGIVANERELIAVRQSAYWWLRGVMGMDLFRYLNPEKIEIPDEVDWELINTCLRRDPYTVRDEDLPYFERAEKRAPNLYVAMRHFRQGDEEFDSGNYTASISHYSDGLALSPLACGALCMRGCAYGNLGDLDAAVADFNAAIDINSDEPIYYRERAEAYRRKGQHDLAQADERKAEELEQRSQ